MLKCEACNQFFSRRDYFNRHNDEYHNEKEVKHYNCSENRQHINSLPNFPKIEKYGFIRIVVSQCFDGLGKEIRFYSENDMLPQIFLYEIQEFVNETIQILKENDFTKIVTKLCVEFETDKTEKRKRDEAYFTVSAIPTLSYNFDFVSLKLLEKINTYDERNSAWRISKTLFLQLQVVRTLV